MSPAFLEDDYVISLNPKLTKLKEGNIIVFEHSTLGFLIKKIHKKTAKGYCVKGTSPMSIDAKSVGLVNKKMIKGKVIIKIRKKRFYE